VRALARVNNVSVILIRASLSRTALRALRGCVGVPRIPRIHSIRLVVSSFLITDEKAPILRGIVPMHLDGKELPDGWWPKPPWLDIRA
jgi:hypothetical protein